MPIPSLIPVAKCPKCDGTVTHHTYDRVLELAFYHCECGTQFTVEVRRPTS
jgi:hypothetical protein